MAKAYQALRNDRTVSLLEGLMADLAELKDEYQWLTTVAYGHRKGPDQPQVSLGPGHSDPTAQVALDGSPQDNGAHGLTKVRQEIKTIDRDIRRAIVGFGSGLLPVYASLRRGFRAADRRYERLDPMFGRQQLRTQEMAERLQAKGRRMARGEGFGSG